LDSSKLPGRVNKLLRNFVHSISFWYRVLP
jgi:hypothetical protein